MKIYNSYSRKEEEFIPLNPNQVGVYCCGPTVYDYQHIGNLRTYIFEDLLVRTLRYAGYKVKHVMNITDVGHLVSDADEGEDKMLVAAKREKKSSHEIAEYYTNVFFEDCAALNIKRPDVVCKATDHIDDMISLIKRLEKRGMTYFSGGNVYYDVSRFPEYGRMANLDLKRLKAGARIEIDQNKRNPYDFVLWFTKSKFENQELQWDSPWGRGYPGWHIECSAMSMKHLGEQFDIHCGGIDHIPVHHTNEIAQSEGATGKRWVRYWMHGEFLVMDKEKMSKSKGTFITLRDLIKQGIEPLAYRYMCLGAHYRTQLKFSIESLRSAQNSFRKLRSSVLSLKGVEEGTPDKRYISAFEDAMYDDLNAPRALALVWEILGDSGLAQADKLATLYAVDEVLGFGMKKWEEKKIDIPDEVRALLSDRAEARKRKDWDESDRLRNLIREKGFLVEDTKEGQKLKPV
ncbi:MAG: cysteine--tRNA ligase [Candidatus Dadabacteria bacterium]|nr:MAG: cysteine--tRNA ligase [Candidatus Dadabacteria bacterium]